MVLTDHDVGHREGIAALGERLIGRVDELAGELTALIRREVDFYRSSALVSDAELHANLRTNLAAVFAELRAPGRDASAAATETGRSRAHRGVPLPALMDAYRMGSAFAWRTIVAEGEATGLVSTADLLALSTHMWSVQERLTHLMANAYRDVQTQQLLVQEEERSALVAALLEGRITETTTLWEAADVLGLSVNGSYVVVAAALAAPGRQSLPNVRTALRVVDISSAWRLTPDLQIGIVQLRDAAQRHRLLVALRGMARDQVGVSPEFIGLHEVAEALRLARIAMAGSVPDRSLVTVFDEAPLAVAVTAAPPVSRRVARGVLAGLGQIPVADRALLLDTFEAWLDSGGSVTPTARALHCHYNTVRHRLRKLERLTGRSLADPRQQAELCLALEIERRLPPE